MENIPSCSAKSRTTSCVRSLYPVAFHEAGHAVAKVWFSHPFLGVYIRTDGSGMCVGTGTVIQRTRYDLEAEIVATLAGPYAEARATRQGRAWITLAQADWQEAKSMMLALVDSGLIAGMDDANRRFDEYTRDFLSTQWSAIKRVADALVLNLRVTPAAVAALAGLPEVRR